jgi:hypothetical protein
MSPEGPEGPSEAEFEETGGCHRKLPEATGSYRKLEARKLPTGSFHLSCLLTGQA